MDSVPRMRAAPGDESQRAYAMRSYSDSCSAPVSGAKPGRGWAWGAGGVGSGANASDVPRNPQFRFCSERDGQST